MLITAMTSMAQAHGALRILPSGKIPHPVGDPGRSPDEELAWRKEVLKRALEGLQTSVEATTVLT